MLGKDGNIGVGLTSSEVQARTIEFGLNKLEEASRKSPLRIFISQFADMLVLVLVAAAVVATFLGEPQDTIAIAAIVILNAVLGFTQEFRAERAMEALQALASPQARVRRNGQVLTIPAFELVPGDIVLLEAGNFVPADLRVLESFQLTVDESALTGESHAVEKTTDPLDQENLPIGDQRNMAFKGTVVVAGRGTGLVVRTGMATELGRIARLLKDEVEVKTPLQNRLARFAKSLSLAVIGICLVLFIIGLVRGENPVLMFMTALSLAVAAIPEALPAVVTVALALGARLMSQNKALVRKMPAVEALGSVTYICSDKTGTLTQNRMQAGALFADSRHWDQVPSGRSPLWELFLRALALNNDVHRSEEGELQGDPTETALVQLAFDSGFERRELEAKFPRIAELPFSSERGLMSTLHRDGPNGFVLTKGAPEKVFPLCTTWLSNKGESAFKPSQFHSAVGELAERGFRVLALAMRRMEGSPEKHEIDQIEADLCFLGLVGLIDPPREGAKEAVALCRSAGIHAVMITGDHPATARAIARQLGIVSDDRELVLTGQELTCLSDEELIEKIHRIAVYARVAPEQKIRIVKALQASGEIVSMTGDGVNDAPALRRADVGVSMGKGGTDVAREASHVILLDDNFSTIVAAVREGRRIYDNIRKFVRFALSGNSGEVWTLFLAPFVGLPTPLLPIHILWVNLVTDGLPGLALAMEPAERGIMKRPPRSPRESIFARGLWQHAIWVGLLTAGATLGTMAWAYHTGHAHWQSMAFTVLTLIQMGHVMAIRSETDSLFTLGIFSNLPLLGAVVLTFGLQMATLYAPALNEIFKTEPLSWQELSICLLVSTSVFIAVEFEKWLSRRSLR